MIHALVDRWITIFRPHRKKMPSWARKQDPLLPRLRPSYRWWVRW